MDDDSKDSKGDEFVLVPSDESLTKSPKPTLMQAGERWMTSDGRWHPELAADYVVQHGGLHRWIPVGELARVFFASGSPSNKARVRQRMHQIVKELLAKHFLLVVEYGEHNRAMACKIYDAKSEVERQYIHARLARMQHLKTLKVELFERAVTLAQLAEEELVTSAV